ncbi:ATP-binding cassette domain-containing protein, partial [Cellulosimicrobium cellulans]|uniref:ATP-binding cassette domain-containing protein n=1 Tax=Cellulosimicrobium cellulans TaxID=1710 RepID=UPI0018841A61
MARPTPVLRASDVRVSFAGRAVLRGVDLAVDPGHRTGLVGENGVGKSTLLRVLAGTLAPDDGTVSRPADLGFLHQEFPYPPTTTVRAVVDDALVRVRAIERALEEAALALAGEPGGEPAPGAEEAY